MTITSSYVKRLHRRGSDPSGSYPELYWRTGVGLRVWNGSAFEDVGGTTAPDGSPGDIQYNNAGAFGGSGLITIGATVPQINDSSGNELLKFVKTASAINELTATNAATGTPPVLAATGGDTNISLGLRVKGSGNFLFQNAAGTSVLAIDSSGNIGAANFSAYIGTASNRISLVSTDILANGPIYLSNNFDTGIYRSAAGVAEINNGTVGQYRDLRARQLVATGDSGGTASMNTLTNGENTGVSRSTGVGSIKFADSTSRDNAGFIKIYIGTTAYYIPVFLAN